MSEDEAAGPWKVDYTRNLASRGPVLIRFSEAAEQGFCIAFVAGAASSLEEQCLIAGEATMAIQGGRRAI